MVALEDLVFDVFERITIAGRIRQRKPARSERESELPVNHFTKHENIVAAGAEQVFRYVFCPIP